MKWKQFLLIWLILFLLAPSIWFHTQFIEGTSPLFMPFGTVQLGIDCWEQLIRGDFADSLMILFQILPILIYTFLLSWPVYYAFRKVRQHWLSTHPHP